MSTLGDSTTPSGRSLAGVRALEALSPEALEAVGRMAHWHRYHRSQLVIGNQDLSTDVYFIASGSVRVTTYSPSGKEVTFRDLEAGEMFGELAAIDGNPRSADIVALSDCDIASISAGQFRGLVRDHPEFAVSTLGLLAELVRALSDRVFEISALNVRNRIHAEILRLARAHPIDENRAMIAPAPTHSEIANRISTHREAVARELNEMSRSGLLTREGHTIFVNDVDRLARLVEDVMGSSD